MSVGDLKSNKESISTNWEEQNQACSCTIHWKNIKQKFIEEDLTRKQSVQEIGKNKQACSRTIPLEKIPQKPIRRRNR